MTKFDGFTKLKGSGHLDAVKYESYERKMTVRFQNGAVYDVHGVQPQAYQDFMDAPSQGQHYHDHIKDNYAVERVK